VARLQKTIYLWAAAGRGARGHENLEKYISVNEKLDKEKALRERELTFGKKWLDDLDKMAPLLEDGGQGLSEPERKLVPLFILRHTR